jgi:flagellar protein FlaG
MIVQNVTGQGTLPVRTVGGDVPAAVADTPAQGTTVQPASTHASAIPPPSAEQLKGAVDSINKALQQSNQNLVFSVDPGTKTPVVKMTDAETGRVISQYPSEAVLAIAQSIDQYLSEHQLKQGLLLKQKA